MKAIRRQPLKEKIKKQNNQSQWATWRRFAKTEPSLKKWPSQGACRSLKIVKRDSGSGILSLLKRIKNYGTLNKKITMTLEIQETAQC